MNRLDFDFEHEGGIFPQHIESNNDPAVARWLEEVIHMVPVAPRPEGYNPLGVKNLDPQWIRRLGQTGKDCYDAILRRDVSGPGRLDERVHGVLGGDPAAHGPASDDHASILPAILAYYQSKYAGAMYSGCGGGYLYVVSETPVPGSIRVTVRIAEDG